MYVYMYICTYIGKGYKFIVYVRIYTDSVIKTILPPSFIHTAIVEHNKLLNILYVHLTIV